MLHSIRIQGFRGIETVELKELKNINVLIGENNSGKTSILEAIQLLKDANVIANLYSAAQKRENITAISRSASVDIVKYCFNLERGMELSVDAYDYWGETICASVWGHESSFIEENYSNSELTNQLIARKNNISEVYMRRLFVKEYKITPKQYITDIRIKKAEQLLSEGTLSVGEIAVKCGFGDIHHFSRVFKKVNAVSPLEYRRENTNTTL